MRALLSAMPQVRCDADPGGPIPVPVRV